MAFVDQRTRVLQTCFLTRGPQLSDSSHKATARSPVSRAVKSVRETAGAKARTPQPAVWGVGPLKQIITRVSPVHVFVLFSP
ncbi:hypothetical protein J6590_047103 [Homalodisca vitripennis]|nr:hypothetical protein J6590_047103 [Homalodisca vitripennis]